MKDCPHPQPLSHEERGAVLPQSGLPELVVDGRGLEPPEPMERVLAALDALQPGQRVRFLIHRQPYPLYDLLRRHGYSFTTTETADGQYEILISPP